MTPKLFINLKPFCDRVKINLKKIARLFFALWKFKVENTTFIQDGNNAQNQQITCDLSLFLFLDRNYISILMSVRKNNQPLKFVFQQLDRNYLEPK